VTRGLCWTAGPPAARAALVSTLGVLALGGLVLTTYTALRKPVPFAVDPDVTPFYGPYEVSAHLSLIKPFFDARGQTLAHLAMTTALGLLVLLAPRLPARLAHIAQPTGVVTALVLLAAPLYAPGPKAIAFGAGFLGLLLLLLAGRWLQRTVANGVLGALTLAAVATATLPGFLGPPDFSRVSWPEMAFAQSHWSVVAGAGDLLAAGRRLFEDVRLDYGVLLPLVVAGGQRWLGASSFGGEVHFLQGLQTLYLFLAAFLFWRHARGRWLFAALALLTVLPWHHFAHRSLLFPNQSPWRTIGVPLCLAALWGAGTDRPRSHAFRLGLAAGTALLLNFESGTAMTAGLAAFLYFRYGVPVAPGRLRRAFALAAPFGAGLVGAAVSTLFLGRLLVGAWIPLTRLPALFVNAIFLSSSGFSGFPLVADPWPLLLFAHAAFVLVQTALTFRDAPAGFRASFRAAVAVILVIWFAYYANRPHPWNLSSYYLLYGFLLIDLARATLLGVARRRFGVFLAASLAALGAIALPNVLAMAAKGAQQIAGSLGPALRHDPPPGASLLSGAFLEAGGSDAVATKAATIRLVERPLYFTADSWLVPKVSGVFPEMPAIDACWESMTRSAYRRIVDAAISSGAPRIYFDPPGTPASFTVCEVFYRRLRGDLAAHFERTDIEGGWEIWTRR